jgi:hypothetical protein
MKSALLNKWPAISGKGMVILMLATLMTACSVESKLNKNYKGKSFLEVMEDKGAPTSIENLVGGGTIRIYIKKEMLKEAPINTGQFQYDKFNSPKVLKTEITEFYVDPDGIVKNIKYTSEFSK